MAATARKFEGRCDLLSSAQAEQQRSLQTELTMVVDRAEQLTQLHARMAETQAESQAGFETQVRANQRGADATNFYRHTFTI